MENISKFFMVSMTALIFVMAISILFITNREGNKTIDLVKKDVQESPVLSSTDDIKANNDNVKYHELIARLMLPLDYDIKIINKEVVKEDHNFSSFDFGSISERDYERSYEYSKDGDIEKVVYR